MDSAFFWRFLEKFVRVGYLKLEERVHAHFLGNSANSFSGVFLVLFFTSDNVETAQNDQKLGFFDIANFVSKPSGKTYLVLQFARIASVSSSYCSLTPLLRAPSSAIFDFRLLTSKIRYRVITSLVGKEGRTGTTRPSQHPAFVAATLL